MVLFIKNAGSHREMGIQQGEQLKAKIADALDQLLHSELISEVKPKIVPLSLLKAILGWLGKRSTKKYLEKYVPKQHEKMLGIAEGAGLKKGLTYGLHFIEVLNGVPSVTFQNVPQQCTMMFALPPATVDNSIIYARNYDFPNILQPFQMVREETPDEGYKTFSITQYPSAGCHMGLNEKGLAVGLNYGKSWKKEPLDFRLKGVPFMFIAQEVLETCATVEEAVEYVSKFPARSNGGHYGLVDKSGDACVVETTTTRFAIRRPDEKGLLAHTNDYRTEKLADANTPDYCLWKVKGMTDTPYIESPRRRFAKAMELLNKNHGKLDVATFQKILSDHTGGNTPGEPDDFTLCVHGISGSTLASIIMKPETGDIWVTDNRPCQTPYEKFTLPMKK